ncbi:MAG TPA: porin family protein [Sulfurovum sp.]|nr:porin family protein [Sulfurovum sp.]
MKKTLLAAALSAQLATQLFAGGDIAPVEVHEPEVMEHESESKFYVVAKALMLLGDDVNHGEAVLDGDRDYGYGIDLGYRLGNGFALEYDFSYGLNTVSEIDAGEVIEEARAKYYTSALDLVYTYEVTEDLGIFAKAGYEYEWEKIAAYDIDSEDHGFVFGAGVEVAMSESYKLIAEYEHSTIEGPRGDSIFAGVMYNF